MVEGLPPLFLCQDQLHGSLQVGAILPTLNPSRTQPILKLHWLGEICLLYPVSLWNLTLPSPQIAPSGPIVRQLAPSWAVL